MCRLRIIAMRDYQDSDYRTYGQTDRRTDRRRTKWSLCAAMLRRRHKNAVEWNNLNATYVHKGASFYNNTQSATPACEIVPSCDYLYIFHYYFLTTMKVNRIGPHNRHWGALAGKCLNNRTGGRSRNGQSWSYIVSEGGTFMEVSCMQVIPFHCVGLLGGAWEWVQRSYIKVMTCLCFNVSTNEPCLAILLNVRALVNASTTVNF